MEEGLEALRSRFDAVRVGLSENVDRGTGLIEELLRRLDRSETELTQTRLDLENESDTRRRLQLNIQDNKELQERQGRRPFVVTLIDADADGYVFHNRFIANGERGGEEAADSLLEALQGYMQKTMNEFGRLDFHVRAFANVDSLARAFVHDERLQDVNQLRAFTTGFSNRQPFFDFVDVAGKERANHKIREGVKFYLESSQCKRLVLACGHDSGYASFLGQFVGEGAARRITLLEGGSKFPLAIDKLGLETTKFTSLFHEVAPAVLAVPRGPMRGHLARNGATTNGGSSTAPLIRAGIHEHEDPKAKWQRLGPIQYDERGRRIDRPLPVDDTVVENLNRGGLCYFLYLRGECKKLGNPCPRDHRHKTLSDAEFDALWSLARQSRCWYEENKGKNCPDERCVYGHGCS